MLEAANASQHQSMEKLEELPKPSVTILPSLHTRS